jgi:hypothetical protein
MKRSGPSQRRSAHGYQVGHAHRGYAVVGRLACRDRENDWTRPTKAGWHRRSVHDAAPQSPEHTLPIFCIVLRVSAICDSLGQELLSCPRSKRSQRPAGNSLLPELRLRARALRRLCCAPSNLLISATSPGRLRMEWSAAAIGAPPGIAAKRSGQVGRLYGAI